MLKQSPAKFLIIASLLLLQACSNHQSVIDTKPATLTAAPEKKHILKAKVTHQQPPKKILAKTIDSWQYLASLFSLTHIDNAHIQRQIKWFLKHPRTLESIQKNAEPYLYDIINQVQAKGLPAEFALLPAIESGFKARAYSHAGASGLWQFIAATGKHYGLKQNKWYDGRRDIHASTHAATTYLKDLHRINKDWLLALASYNLGQGNLNRAIRRNKKRHKPTDFWSLKLPKETRLYVPKLLALAKIFAQPKKYGISLYAIPYQASFARVKVNSQLKLSTAAKLSNQSLADFKLLNPAFNKSHTPKKAYDLLIPIDNMQSFAENLNRDFPKHKSQWLKNNQPQKTLYAFAEKKAITPTVEFIKPPSDYYTVKNGESLWLIARRLDLHSKDIAQWSHINLTQPLRLGQRLRISPPSTNTLTTIKYTVRFGDSLFNISEKFKIKLTDLHKWNTGKLNNPLTTGQQLTLKIAANP